MVHDQGRVRCALRQSDKLIHLVVVMPAVIGDPTATKQPNPFAKPFILRQTFWRRTGCIFITTPMITVCNAMAYSAEPAIRRRLMSLEDLLQSRIQRQVSVGDDSGDFRPWPNNRFARDFGDPFGLANRP